MLNLPLARAWLGNLYRARLRGETLLAPMGVTWHATDHCNLRCRFCDDGKGNCYPEIAGRELSTSEAKAVLALARAKVAVLYVTGGEPLLRRDLGEILRWAKTEAGFRYVGMVTNGLLLRGRAALLAHVDDLAVSLHTLDERRGDELLGARPGATRAVIDAVLRYGDARRAGVGSYRFSVSCVARPGQIEDARAVMRFCFAHGLAFALMPQSVRPYPHEGLRGDPAYRALVDEILAAKRAGLPVWGSEPYFRTIRAFSRFRCYPTTVPRIFANGDLGYPCAPLGTVAGSLVGARSFDAVLAEGVRRHGPIPRCDTRCFAQCYIESSHAIEHPLALLRDNAMLFYRSRVGPAPTAVSAQGPQRPFWTAAWQEPPPMGRGFPSSHVQPSARSQ
jgi:pyruvate-formate lyase-activating enzyme